MVERTLKLDVPAVRRFMNDKGWSICDLSWEVRITRQAIYVIFEHESCTLKVLGRICDALECTPNDILTNN